MAATDSEDAWCRTFETAKVDALPSWAAESSAALSSLQRKSISRDA